MANTSTVPGATENSGMSSIAKRIAVSVGLVTGSVVVGLAFAIALGFGVAATTGGLPTDFVSVLDLVTTQSGFAVVALGFLGGVTGWRFVEIRRPSRRELRLVIPAVATVLAIEALRQLAVRQGYVGVAGTLSAPEEMNAAAVAVLLGLTVLVAPPIEELFFRGVVQQYVADAASPAVGIAVATILFVPVHGLGILLTASSLMAAVVVVFVLVVLSTVLGVAYARTQNLTIPVMIHAGYNLLTLFVVIGVQRAPLAAVFSLL
ncbi:CPBP family intramembrane metalloprotease (plasmid) [Haloferax larsenii]|uniref:CPBP family intramembrane metalloprotease n=1 Tax=Haloferax larsenii TaxID=302484 RepID=A0ABY5RHZ3_HALLR|nr:type II CAAX endopeptidase family protein [Haloferax larsenii]UVE51987.1 CPBP family intramembrane metalloprotease [Haloferax larsenii]